MLSALLLATLAFTGVYINGSPVDFEPHLAVGERTQPESMQCRCAEEPPRRALGGIPFERNQPELVSIDLWMLAPEARYGSSVPSRFPWLWPVPYRLFDASRGPVAEQVRHFWSDPSPVWGAPAGRAQWLVPDGAFELSTL